MSVRGWEFWDVVARTVVGLLGLACFGVLALLRGCGNG